LIERPGTTLSYIYLQQQVTKSLLRGVVTQMLKESWGLMLILRNCAMNQLVFEEHPKRHVGEGL
jgi:hypothetical protein